VPRIPGLIISCYPYGEDCGGLVDLAGDGRKLFPITPAFTLEEKGRVGNAKHNLVKKRVLEHYKRYKTEKDALNLPPTLPGASLEQELENRRLRSEILRERQQNEALERQVQELKIENQNLKLQVEQHEPPMTTAEIGSWMHDLQGIDLQPQIQDPQAQQNLQQPQQFQFQNSQLQVEDLQRPIQDQQYLQQAQQLQALDLQPQPSSLQQHQREEELFTIDENCAVPFGTEPFQEEAGFGAKSPSFWGGYPTDG
jgi:hypothetical protein